MRIRSRKGFTLIELLIVIVIVGVLAAVSIPMLKGNVDKAKASEAVAALGSIRTQMRVMKATDANNDYPVFAAGTAVVGNVDGFEEAGSLDGKYFVDANYTITSAADTFTAQALNGDSLGARITEGGDITWTVDGAAWKDF